MRTSLIFVIVAGLGAAIVVGAIITTAVVLVSRSRRQSNAVASAPQVSELNQS